MTHRRSDAKWRARLCGVAVMLVAAHAQALFIVNQPWVIPAARGASTEVYMDLTSTEGATVVGVRTDAAAAAALLRPGKPSRAAESIVLAPGKLMELRPSSYRIALQRLVRPLKLGDRLLLTLTIQAGDGTRQDIAVDAEARPRSPIEDDRAHKHAH